MNNRIVFGIAIVIILLVSLPTTDVVGNQPIENSTLADNQAPIVDSPLDIIYVEGTTGHTITWEISDDDPSYWVIYRNGGYLTHGDWVIYNETVIQDVDGLSVGKYEYVIVASDSIINTTDIVLVTVLSTDIEIHAPFSISSNNDFNDTAQAEGWIGNGSLTNPFVIEKLYIEASYDCISIHGTTVYFIIRNCTFVKDGIESGIGLNMQSVDNGIIENCTFTNLWIGCITWFVSNCTWNDNTFGNLLDGIWLQESTNCIITDNSFQSGGVSIAGYDKSNWIHQIAGNTIGEKSLGYFEGQSLVDIDATDYGQIILANCSEVTVYNGDFSNVGISISIGHSNFSTAHGCHIDGGRTGIFLERTYETLIETCSIVGSTEIGLYINETILTTVYNCTIRNIGDLGAMILMGSNVTFLETTIKGCGYSGIAIYESPYFFLLDSILEDNYSGLEIGGCPESEISGNTIQLNDQYGIFIMWGCEGSRIFGNEFVFNYIENANDDGSGTLWDDGMAIGNLWNDYSGSGYYYVPGSRGGIDHYPGIVDLDHGIDILGFLTDDITYTHGTIGHSIVWYTNCTHPSMYYIFKDGVLIEQQAWDGDWINYNVDGLAVGVYNFTLAIWDTFYESASDTVIVEVIAGGIISGTTTPTINSTTTTNSTGVGGIQEITLVISIGSTIVIVIVIVLMLRTKRGPM